MDWVVIIACTLGGLGVLMFIVFLIAESKVTVGTRKGDPMNQTIEELEKYRRELIADQLAEPTGSDMFMAFGKAIDKIDNRIKALKERLNKEE